jgi:hypothetical protein
LICRDTGYDVSTATATPKFASESGQGQKCVHRLRITFTLSTKATGQFANSSTHTTT